jgi:anti-anti-sigma factor
MGKAAGIFEIELEGETLIVTPVTDLSELNYPQIEAGMNELLQGLADMQGKHVVLDFHRTDYYGTTALSCFLKIWKRVVSSNGKMVFCNVSEHEQEILKITKLDHLWPIYPSRQAALQAIQS